jgi:hypothetical protein
LLNVCSLPRPHGEERPRHSEATTKHKLTRKIGGGTYIDGRRICIFAAWMSLAAATLSAADPFFVTYSHELQPQGDLEVSLRTLAGGWKTADWFDSETVEFEYGATDRWTTSVYLDAEYSPKSNARFTGYRWENRIRLIRREHPLNPVLYVEVANTSSNDRSILDVIGRERISAPTAGGNCLEPVTLEGRLILSSNVSGWTLAENIIAERTIHDASADVGYAIGVARPLTIGPEQERCKWCAANIKVGAELYGGLGTLHRFGLAKTVHYAAASLSWTAGTGTALSFSAGFAIGHRSGGAVLRVTIAHDVDDFGRSVRNLFRSVTSRL